MIRWAAALCLLAAPAGAVDCRDTTYAGNSYTLCSVDPRAEPIRLFLRGPDGTPWGTFAAIEAALGPLAFAMNAGMYHEDRAPVGLYVENGQQEMRLLTGASGGNFGLLPNGVFCVRGQHAFVIESRALAAQDVPCDQATQSGPLLLNAGVEHPRFLPDSTSRNIRNGVGTSADGATVTFAISNDRVTFHEFALLFRDGLGLPDALYFDGRVSRLHAPALGRSDAGAAMGPVVGVMAGG